MKLYLLFLGLMILIAGCTGTTSRISSDAIVVNDFSVDPVIAEEDDLVVFFLDIENVGGTTAQCVTTEMFGIESWYDELSQPLEYARPWRTSGVGFSYNNGRIGFSYWDPDRGHVNVGYDRNAGTSLSVYIGGAWSSFSSDFCSTAGRWGQFADVKYFDSMRPAIPSQGRPGQSFTTQWLLRPPVLPEGAHAVYPVTARTSYQYTSNAVVNLQAFNKNEQQRRDALGEPYDLPLVVETSYASPIQIVPTRGVNPIIVNQRQQGFELVNYVFEFQNVGNGWPLPFGSDVVDTNGLIFATVELDGPGASFYDCLGASTGTEIFVYGDFIENLVQLRSDGRAPFGCTIAMDRASWADRPIGTISLTFNLWYRYYTDAQTVVEVIGPQSIF